MSTVDLEIVRTFEAWADRELRNNVRVEDMWIENQRGEVRVASGFPPGTQTIALSVAPAGRPARGTVIGRVRVRIGGTVNGVPYERIMDLAPQQLAIVDGRGMERAEVAILASNIALVATPTTPQPYLLRVSPTPFSPDDAADRYAWRYETYPSTTVDYVVPTGAVGFVVQADDPGFVFRHYNQASPAALVSFPWSATRGDLNPIGGEYFRVSIADLQVAWKIKL